MGATGAIAQVESDEGHRRDFRAGVEGRRVGGPVTRSSRVSEHRCRRCVAVCEPRQGSGQGVARNGTAVMGREHLPPPAPDESFLGDPGSLNVALPDDVEAMALAGAVPQFASVRLWTNIRMPTSMRRLETLRTTDLWLQ